MNFFVSHPTAKKYLLPLVMAVAVFFISQGIEIPNFSDLQEPQLSVSQKIKSSDSAVVKTVTKCSQIKTIKTANSWALVDEAFQIKSPAVLVSVFQHQPRLFISAVVSIIPARAPPA